MRRALLIVLLVAVAGCGGDEPAGPGESSSSRACPAGLRAWQEAGFDGSVMVTTAGATTCAIDGDRRYGIGSVSKSFTAAAILQLADARRLSLDDRAGELLAGLRGPAARATVQDLLLHRGGIRGAHAQDADELDQEDAIRAIGGLEAAFDPGTGFLYSNAGYTLLALMVDRLSGSAYRPYLAANVMRGGGFVRPERGQWATAGNGDLEMTARQLAGWTRALFAGDVVSRAARRRLTRFRGPRAETPGWVAYDASRLGQRFYASAGGGGDTGENVVTVWLPAQGRVMTMASSGASAITAEELLRATGPALAAGDVVPPPPQQAGAARRVAGPAAAAHEASVRRLLAGTTREGRQERAFLRQRYGGLDDLEVLGTVDDDGELRTYLTASRGRTRETLWYAMEDHDQIAAAMVPAPVPAALGNR